MTRDASGSTDDKPWTRDRCRFPAVCVVPDPYHDPEECHTGEDVEAWEREADDNPRELRVYVAGASAEMDRARRAVERLHRAGIVVTSTWLDVIAEVGASNPADATAEQRRAWAEVDLEQVASADVLWMLVPAAPATTRGAWGELCYAFASGLRIVCSGPTKQSIFCALADEYASDAEALGAILGMAVAAVVPDAQEQIAAAHERDLEVL